MRYRAYLIDANEHVRNAFDIRAETAAEAVQRAAGLKERQVVEVWEVETGEIDGDRLLKRFEPTSLFH